MTLKEAIALYESIGKSYELYELQKQAVERWKAKQRNKQKPKRITLTQRH